MSPAHHVPTLRAVCIALCLALGLACSPAEVPGPIEAGELAARIGSDEVPIILDVRTPEEFAAGHVPGAINIPHTELAARLGEIDASPSSEIVVHCESGRRARVAEEVLHEAGFTRVRMLSGHMSGWREGGHPIE